MSRKYSTIGTQDATAADSIVSVESATTIRPEIYEILFGSAATPADQAFNMQLKRFTAAGTSTAVTPQALESGHPPSLAVGGSNHTVEPTYTAGATMLSFSLNQQATFRWAVPPGEGIVAPATANNGLGLQFVTVSGGTALCESGIHHIE